MASKEQVKVGVVGCGWITGQFKITSKIVKNTKIIAAMDLDLNRAKKIAGDKHAYTDLEKMIHTEDIDVIYIATPHHLHKPMIQQAFEMGKHVLCEKPVAASLEDAREISNLKKKYPNLKLGFNYNYRYDHDCFRLATGIKENHIGKIYYANCNVFFSRGEDYYNKGAWRAKKETAGGGTLIIHGSHLIDVMLWALGEPLSVMGKVDNMRFKNIEVEDVALGIVEFECGAYAQINDSSLVKPPLSIFKDKVELQIFGEKGRCHYKGPWPLSSLKWKGVKKFKIAKNTKGISHFGRSIKAFGNWVLHDKPYLNTIEESSRVLRLISALYKSSETGRKMDIEKL